MATIVIEIVLSLFKGFAIFILATSIPFVKGPRTKEILNALTDSSVVIIRIAALAFLVTWLGNLYVTYQHEEDHYITVTRMFGPYWFGYWMYPLCYGIVPQVLWVKKLKQQTVIRVFTALALLFGLYFERMIIWITSMHRDYVPSNWTLLPGHSIVYDSIIDLITFGSFLFILYLVRRKTSTS